MKNIEWCQGVPYDYESFLIEKYHSYVTTCRYLEIYYPGSNINYMLIYEDGKLIHLLIYTNKNRVCTCLNSVTEIEQDIIKAFTESIFEKYCSIQKVKLICLYGKYSFKRFYIVSKEEDLILQLPESIEDYNVFLGKKTRKEIKKSRLKLIHDYPNTNIIIQQGKDINRNVLEAIIKMNAERMYSKGIIPGINKTYRNRIIKYAQNYGVLCYIEVEGEIIAGCIASMIHKDVFSQIVGHKTCFNNYCVGKLCLWNLIKYAIEKEAFTFHFLWGKGEYKSRFLAQPQMVYSYFVCKSFSFNCFIAFIKAAIIRDLFKFKDSEVSIPIKNVIRFFRKIRLRTLILKVCFRVKNKFFS